jgi:hypothetical protein
MLALLFAFGTPAHAGVTASPATLNFGNQAMGITSAPIAVTVTNTGWHSTTIMSASFSAAQFSYSGSSLPITLYRGQSLIAYVKFTPTAAQPYSGTLVFTRGNGWTISVPLSGTGVQPPTITTQPVSQTVTAGQTASFSVAASGTAPLTYQWKKNGTAISGATSSTYTTSGTTTSDNASLFTIVVTNSAGTVTSAAATLVVNAAAVAPAITTQPVSQTVTAGQTASFSVAASGMTPMTYQWKKNGTAMSGATSSTYTTPATTTSDNAAQFIVVITNSAGSATSTGAILTVNAAAAAPAITTQPVSQTVTAGQTASFSVAASGTTPMTFQWKKNGTAISGATSSMYTTPGTTTSDNASLFTVVVTNSAGTVTSSAATLAVNAATPGCVTSSGTWINLPLSATQTGNFRFTFDAVPSGAAIDGVIGLSSGVASGYTNLAAIVRFNSTGSIDARNGSNYTAATVIPYSAGTTYHFILDVSIATHTYKAYVMVGSVQTTIGLNYAFRTEQATVSSLNNMGAVTSAGSQTICNIGLSTLMVAPTITTQPVSQTVTAGQTASFSVAASGMTPMTYQWKKNGTAMSGATSSTYTTPATTASDNTMQFTVVVTNSAGSATSTAATLTVNAATYVLNASSTALSFGSVTLSTTSSKNVTFTNAGNSNVTISNVSVTGAGFNARGVSTGLIVAPGQAATLTATFTPSATGSVTGNVTVSSNASADAIALSGTGVAAVSHSVALSWAASTSAVTGYYTYFSNVSGGPYAKLNSTPDPMTTYTDSTVQSGKTYYYVVTAVDSSNVESLASNEISATIP